MNWQHEILKIPQILLQVLQESKIFNILLLDTDGNILDCNDAFSKLMNLKEKPIGKNLKEFLFSENSLEQICSKSSDVLSRFCLYFIGKNKLRYNLSVCSIKLQKEYILFGEKVTLEDQEILEELANLNNEQLNISHELQRKNIALQKAMAEIKMLQGLLSICSSCKKIKNDAGLWTQLEEYISEHTQAEFSHGLCEECCQKLYPEIYTKILKKRSQSFIH